MVPVSPSVKYHFASCPLVSDDGSLSRWVDSRLDLKKNLPADLPAGHINILQCVRYRIKTGLSIRVNQAFGLEGTTCILQYCIFDLVDVLTSAGRG